MLEPSDPARPGAVWDRRAVLRRGLGLAVGLPALASGISACTAGPAVDNPSAPTRGATAVSPTATTGSGAPQGPAPAVPAEAKAELDLAAYAAAVLAGPHKSALGSGGRTLLAFLRDAHTRHAEALASDDPTSRPSTGSLSTSAPDIARLSLKESLKRLAVAESTQARRQKRAAVTATGLEALLHGSLGVAADSYAAALAADDPPPVAATRTARPAALLSDVAATQATVAQLHAIVYGYQLAIGKLKVGSSTRSRALRGLADQRALLDELIAVLNKRSAQVPAAEPAYVPNPNPTSASSAAALIRSMQTRLVPYAGLLLAAAGSEGDRTRALTILATTQRTARTWGAPLRAWPGWSD